jgi:hypothetical protein
MRLLLLNPQDCKNILSTLNDTASPAHAPRKSHSASQPAHYKTPLQLVYVDRESAVPEYDDARAFGEAGQFADLLGQRDRAGRPTRC